MHIATSRPRYTYSDYTVTYIYTNILDIHTERKTQNTIHRNQYTNRYLPLEAFSFKCAICDSQLLFVSLSIYDMSLLELLIIIYLFAFSKGKKYNNIYYEALTSFSRRNLIQIWLICSIK